MRIRKEKVKRVLVISLSNIGDVILTFPVIDTVKENFPKAELDLVVGPKAEPLFKDNPHIHRLYIFNKKQKLRQTIKWIWHLRNRYYDLIVDLRNTAIPIFLPCRYRTSLFMVRSEHKHMCWQHLNRLKSVFSYQRQAQNRYALHLPAEEIKFIKKTVQDKIGLDRKFVVVAPGAASEEKRWGAKRFAEVCDYLIDTYGINIVFVGDLDDRKIIQKTCREMHNAAINLSGEISLIQLACLYQHCLMTLVNDSAPMHLASYLDIPVLAIFGPTDPRKYGPWGANSFSIAKKDRCEACRIKKKTLKHNCMQEIQPKDIQRLIKIDENGVEFTH